MAVRLPASIPSVTCSAVVADPNPLGPGQPVISEIIPTIFPKPQKLSSLPNRKSRSRDRERESLVFY